MRMLTLQLLWKDWDKISLHLGRPELKLDGTNNASERGDRKKQGEIQEYARIQEHRRDG
jgi:hypothetical protein